MKLTDRYDGSSAPFEGDKTLAWTSLPAGASVRKATLTLTPVSANGVDLFQEEIDFTASQGSFGATKATDNQTFVEIDFHRRRTLVSVAQTGLNNAHLQVDMGGVYLDINAKGAIPSSPTDPLFKLGSDNLLPGLTVSKFRLYLDAPGSPDITSVTVRSVPSNITARVGKLAPFWPRVGDLTTADTSPDFADVLTTFLAKAQVANGYYSIPLTIHSDTLARVQATLDVDIVQQVSMMPDGVDQVIMPIDYSSVPGTPLSALSVKIPASARVLSDSTTARVTGVFDDTRVVYGPTGFIDPAALKSALVAATDSQAEQFSLDAPAAIFSVDLFIAPAPPGAILSVDIRADLGGKPDSVSLLAGRPQATVPSRSDGLPVWTNIPLSAALQLQGDTDKTRSPKYWLVLQSLQGQASWPAQPQAQGIPVMQHTQDGGLSWRESAVPGVTAPAALFRLRTKPAQFQMPIEAQVGAPNGTRISLDKFQASGRVNLDLSFPEFAQGFNNFLQKNTAGGCGAGEHLLNSNLESWVLVGNTPGSLASVDGFPSSSSTPALAFTGDGETAYAVLDDDSGDARLLTIDVACNRVSSPPLDLPQHLGPQQLRIFPDGSKALVAGAQFALIDLQNNRLLGTSDSQFVDLAFSPDGANIYLLTTSSTAGFSVLSLALLQLETTFFANVLSISQARRLAVANLSGTPVALAAGNDNLYVLSKTGTAGTVTFLDPQTQAPTGNPVTGVGTLAMALSPDGTILVVAGSDGAISIIHTAARDVFQLPLGANVAPTQAAIAIDPAGRFAYVGTSASGSGITISIVDLLHRNVSQNITAQTKAQVLSMAITPQGDELYLGEDEAGKLQYLPIGLRSPAEWFVTSGNVILACIPEIATTAHIIAVLRGASAAGKDTPPQPAAMSQVTPVVGGCNFEFSFEGLSDDPNAVAEVLWRTSGCQSSRTDTVPIPRYTNTVSTVGGREVATRTTVRLIPTSVRLTAPPDATAAEVRFVAPDETAAIALPSLTSGPQSLQNSTLQITQSQSSTPDHWSLSPAGSNGFLVTPSASGVLLGNTGMATADLVQAVAIAAQQDFVLDFLGQGTASRRGANPQIQVRFLDAQGNAVGTAITADILPDTFASHPMQGQAPAEAAQAEVHLSLPTGTSLLVNQISLQPQNTLSVPVTFVASAPGQLRITGAQIGYERTTPSPPSVPASGLCPPTAPGEQPGSQPAGSCQCSCCKSKSVMTGATPAATPGGRPMAVGVCSTCGNPVMQGGGPAGPPVPLRMRVAGHAAPAARSAALATGLSSSFPFTSRIPRVLALTDVTGIGATRAGQLKRVGIETAQELAAADPNVVASALKGVSVSNAEVLIENARNLLSAPH